MCTELTKKNTVNVVIFFLFNPYQNCIARVIFISEKYKQEKAKQRQVEEVLRIMPIMTFFSIQFRVLGILLQLEDNHIKKV